MGGRKTGSPSCLFLIPPSRPMTAYRRWRPEGGTFFFTVVTADRRPLLVDPEVRESLRTAIRRVRSERPFRVDAIVLLPDHLHAVWTLPASDADYSTRWSLIKRYCSRVLVASGRPEVARSASRQAKRERGFWQRRFFEHTVRDEADLKRCVDYVHVNPLRHCLVDRVVDWPWSSFHQYVRLGEYAADWGSADLWYGDEWQAYE
jgi:putative transposase